VAAGAVAFVVLAGLAGLAIWALWPSPDVLLVGDSILRQTGPSLDDELGWGPDVRNEAVNGSGLLTPGEFDWEAELPGMLEGGPDTVVVLFIGNYTDTDLATTADGTPIQAGSPEFFEAWGAASERVATTLLEAGVDVTWVLPPPMLDPQNQAIVDGLRLEYEALAERHPEIELVDGTVALGGENGEFLAQREGEDGDPQTLRAGDGVHLAEAGQDALAAAIADAL
jgi:hypothetical protein